VCKISAEKNLKLDRVVIYILTAECLDRRQDRRHKVEDRRHNIGDSRQEKEDRRQKT